MATTPRRSSRIPHTHTPKMSERKKGLFLSENECSRESLTKHRRLPVVDSESDSEDCDLGIISTLDSSSGEETDQNNPKTPERSHWHETSNKMKKIRETHDLKNFMKSPFTLKKYQTRYCQETKCTGSLSTPATPHLQNHPRTPSSTHSCASAHTTSSTSSRARKSLASLIADTESCSSSLKDLNFDTDSGSDSKENTPTKSVRRSGRRHKMTPKFQSFKGILMEQKKNASPTKNAMICLTRMDMSSYISPTQLLKTPHSTSEKASPPKLSHNRRSVVEIQESPESVCDSEKSHKRLHYDNKIDVGPASKHPRLDINSAPKARLSLFNCDRLKEIISTKSFYGKTNPEMNTSLSTKISNAIEATSIHRRHPFNNHSQRRKRKPGQINLGVKHKIRKPKVNRPKMVSTKCYNDPAPSALNQSDTSKKSVNKDISILSQCSADDKADPFDKEKQTIEALLSQWTEEDIPESELTYTKPRELPCFDSTVIEATDQIFKPITAVPVTQNNLKLQDSESVIVELGTPKILNATNLQNDLTATNIQDGVDATNLQNGVNGTNVHIDQDVLMDEGHAASHGDIPKTGQYLPVEGGYIYVEGNLEQKEIPDLDEIERELQMLDEQILKMAQSNNMDAEAVLASTETMNVPETATASGPMSSESGDTQAKLFPIFSKPNPGLNTPASKAEKSKRCLLKSGDNQYVIDAGQKRFGATQCHECGVIYEIGDPQDEHDHLVHHNATDVLKFNGWKEECVVDRTEHGRCLKVRGGESGWKKVEAVLARVVHPQLGYASDLPGDTRAYTAYLYIEKKQIIGCLIMELKSRAYKLLPGDPDCCSVEDYPVKCGVSRVWTHRKFRRRGVARRLLDCARASVLYGSGVLRAELAFSAPTAAGKAFATGYTGAPDFYVYLD